jgi:hypothetical protein
MKTAVQCFKVKSGTVACTDPCYGTPDVKVAAKNGDWMAHVETSDEGSWGRRVSKILVHHVDFSPVGDCCQEESHTIGVDSGQAGVFDGGGFDGNDSIFYEICCNVTLSKTGYGYVPGGFVSSSGYGDGGYDCLVYKKNGLAVGIEVTFIDHDDEEEDYEDEDDE